MIKELLELQSTLDFEEFGYINLLTVNKQESNLELICHIFTGLDNEPVQQWKILCYEVRENRIILGEQYSDLKLLYDHVLLWSYKQFISSLTFNKANSNVDAHCVIGKLYEKHVSLVDDWIPFGTYFNQHKYLSLEKLINHGYGKLAEGAEKIIIGYKEVLQKCGFKSSYLSRPPKQWYDGKRWIEEDGNVKVLMTDLSYVVASEFYAERLYTK